MTAGGEAALLTFEKEQKVMKKLKKLQKKGSGADASGELFRHTCPSAVQVRPSCFQKAAGVQCGVHGLHTVPRIRVLRVQQCSDLGAMHTSVDGWQLLAGRSCSSSACLPSCQVTVWCFTCPAHMFCMCTMYLCR